MTAAREADTVESTESRLSFTLDHVLCSFSRNSLESLPPSGLPELYKVAILLSRMNRIQLLEQLLSFRSRPHRTTPDSCRHAVSPSSWIKAPISDTVSMSIVRAIVEHKEHF